MPSNNDKLIDAARKFARNDRSCDYIPASEYFQLADILAAFTRSLEQWTPIRSEKDLPKEDGVYLWTCNFGNELDVRKIQLLTMNDGSRRVGPGSNLPLDEIIAWRELPAPYQPQGEGEGK